MSDRRFRMLVALGMKGGTGGQRGVGDRLSNFIATKALSGFIPPKLAEMIANPIRFRLLPPSDSEAR